MIVSEDDSGAAEAGGIEDDFADRHDNRFRLALVTFDKEASRDVINVSDP